MPHFGDVPAGHDLDQVVPGDDCVPPGGEVASGEVDLVGEVPLDLLCQFGGLLVVVVVAVDLVVLYKFAAVYVVVLGEGRPQSQVLFHLRLLLVLVDCFLSGVVEVVFPPVGEDGHLQEKPEEVDLSLLGFADSGDGLDLFEIEEGVDADVVVLFVDRVQSELSERLGVEGEHGAVRGQGVQPIDQARLVLMGNGLLLQVGVDVFLLLSLPVLLETFRVIIFSTFFILSIVIQLLLLPLIDFQVYSLCIELEHVILFVFTGVLRHSSFLAVVPLLVEQLLVGLHGHVGLEQIFIVLGHGEVHVLQPHKGAVLGVLGIFLFGEALGAGTALLVRVVLLRVLGLWGLEEVVSSYVEGPI